MRQWQEDEPVFLEARNLRPRTLEEAGAWVIARCAEDWRRWRQAVATPIAALVLDGTSRISGVALRAVRVQAGGSSFRYKVITVHESSGDLGFLRDWASRLSAAQFDDIETRSAHYQPVMRFILVDEEHRRFAREWFCFRGSVDDWISIGPPGALDQLAPKDLKHLGQDSLYELY